LIRSGAERAIIEGNFQINPQIRAEIQEILAKEDLLDDPEHVTLGREIRSNGRNIARVNGRSVNLSYLREIGEKFVDIHGQSEHLSLLHVSQHLKLLDDFASVDELLARYRNTYHQFQRINRELIELCDAERESARRMDMLSFQINEIEAAHLQPDEEEELLAERNRLANAESLASLAQEARLALDEGTPETIAANDLLGQVVDALNNLARLDPSQTNLAERAQTLFEELTDLSNDLLMYREGIEFNPKRLDQVEERLSLIHGIKKKYGDSIEAVFAFLSEAHKSLEKITHASERIEELEKEKQEILTRLSLEGFALSQKRRNEANQLEQAIETELAGLNMPGTQFKVEFQQRPDPNGLPIEDGQRIAFDASGLEHAEFLIAPNPGEGLKPLAKIASGGETSRLMLALKHVLVSADHVPCLIFDEIDQGIGGRVGAAVGQKLWSLARQHQVFCVTHLPQLAAFGEEHFHVYKEITGGRTITKVEKLHGEKRQLELAQMLGGMSEGILQSARELLENVSQKTSPTA
jgi:DNA repair protein RecN (Recombination protein N)